MVAGLRNRLLRLSIRQRLIFVLLTASLATLLTTTGAFVIKEATSIVNGQRDELTALADIVARNISSSLVFDDPQSAMETMASLKVRKNILAAYVLDMNGRMFSRYHVFDRDLQQLPFEQLPAASTPQQYLNELVRLRATSNKLFNLSGFSSLVIPINVDNQQVGTLVLHGDNLLLKQQLTGTLGTAFLILIAAFGLASLLAAQLQRGISKPILELAQTMQQVSGSKDFTIRVQTDEQNEIGQLYTGFNQMLMEIEERNLVLRQRQEHLQQLAHFDTLTRLPNRTLFYDRLNQAIRYAQRNDIQLALYFIDLDHFKDINDTLGHRMGDLLLKQVADRMSLVLRDCDTVARLGGDEFTVFAQDIIHRDNATMLAQKLLDILEIPFTLESKEVYISGSIGITVFPDDGETVDGLLMNADVAMYHAKEGGKNTYRLFDRGMNQRASERITLAADLRHALERKQFLLHYQPKLDLSTGMISGVEALIRWRHPEMGIIPPTRFIPIAEETGAIVPISEWVIEEACRQVLTWQQQGLPAVSVAVNLSAYHFKRHTVSETVSQILDRIKLNPSLLEVELTESLLMQNNQYTIDALNNLKQLGVTISIDDFGTGYSSLSYLHRFPIDKLKIDRSFVWNMTKNEDDLAIVTAIIAMGKSLRMQIIAEGVETEAQLKHLKNMGCHTIQGYLLSKPLPPDKMAAILSQPFKYTSIMRNK